MKIALEQIEYEGNKDMELWEGHRFWNIKTRQEGVVVNVIGSCRKDQLMPIIEGNVSTSSTISLRWMEERTAS